MVEPDEFPIKFGPVSNGEFYPVPHSPVVRETIRRTHQLADENARRLGMSRRRFLASTTGAAAALFVLSACSKDEARERGSRRAGPSPFRRRRPSTRKPRSTRSVAKSSSSTCRRTT